MRTFEEVFGDRPPDQGVFNFIADVLVQIGEHQTKAVVGAAFGSDRAEPFKPCDCFNGMKEEADWRKFEKALQDAYEAAQAIRRSIVATYPDAFPPQNTDR